MDYFHKVPVILQDEIRCEPPHIPDLYRLRVTISSSSSHVRTARETDALPMHYTVTELNTSHVIIAKQTQ
jgi:hypothetical protein